MSEEMIKSRFDFYGFLQRLWYHQNEAGSSEKDNPHDSFRNNNLKHKGKIL
jgi:hypothetical protein